MSSFELYAAFMGIGLIISTGVVILGLRGIMAGHPSGSPERRRAAVLIVFTLVALLCALLIGFHSGQAYHPAGAHPGLDK